MSVCVGGRGECVSVGRRGGVNRQGCLTQG